MSTDIEVRLRRLFEEKAQQIQERDVSPGAVPAPHVLSLTPTARQHRSPVAFAVAAVLLVVVSAVTTGLVMREPAPETERPPATPSDPLDGVASLARAWPLTADRPLSAGARPEDLATPEAAARAYLTEVAGLPDWPLEGTETSGTVAVTRYVLQDVPATVHLAQSAEGLWYVTGASSDLVQPGAPVMTPKGVDVALAAGPRAYEGGSPVRVTALAADGRLLATATRRLSPTPAGVAGAAEVASLQWDDPELAAAIRTDVLDDHDGDRATPEVVIGHWTAAVASPALRGLPAAFDPATAEPVFTATGSIEEVALSYLRARFPDYPSPGVTTGAPRTRSGLAYVTWSTGSESDPLATGTMLLEPVERGWAVLAATTHGLDLSDIRLEGAVVRGRVRSENINSLFADVLRVDGTPVSGSQRPRGYADAMYVFGSAAGPADGVLDIEVETDDPVPLVRIVHVGGTILSVAEVRLTAT